MDFRKQNSIIKNTEKLVAKGNVEGRKVALEVLDYAIKKIDTYNAVKKMARIENNTLLIGEIEYDLSKLRDIYVLGAGKATFDIAKALEEVLKDRIRNGVIIVKKGVGEKLTKIRVYKAGHPIPDEVGLKGAIEVKKIAVNAGKGDLVFVALTGGCSALMPMPAPKITLKDKMKVNDLLLKSGASIGEINTIRKHMSSIKGGRLAVLIHPAEMVNLIVVDEVAGMPWGPTIPDSTTFDDAISTLKKHDLWRVIPENVRLHLERAEDRYETPKSSDFESIGVKSRTFILSKNEDLCEAIVEKANQLGYNSLILTTKLEGESNDVGVVLSAIAKEVEANNRPIAAPCMLISGGETTVTIIGDCGEGGRNQELALSAALKIAGREKIVLASMGTDGTDGPTEIAGAIVDGYTLRRAEEAGLDLSRELRFHNSSHVFRALEDAIYSGPTGTNVMDIQVLVVTK